MRARTEAATQHIAFALQGGQRVLLVGQADAQVGRQLPGRARPEATQAGAGQLHGRRFRRVRRRIAARRLESVGHLRRGMHQAHRRQALRRQPENAACAVQASGAALLRQLRKPFPPARIGLGLARGEVAQAVQRLMHLVGVARFRPGLATHRLDRLKVQGAEIVGGLGIAPAAILYRLGTPLFQRRIVEIGVGTRGEYLRRQRRRRRQVARQQVHRAALHVAQQGQPAVAIHRLVQAVVEGLRHQRVIGHLALADDILQARHLIGEHAGQQILALHPQQLRRHLATAGIARQTERSGQVPAPAHAEQRRVEHGLYQQMLGARRMQVAPDLVEGKAVAGGQREDDRVLGGRRLQLEVEAAAETLAQRQAPGAVEAAAVRTVDDQLHAAGFVEEAFHHQPPAPGQATQGLAGAGQVLDDLPRGAIVQPEGDAEPGDGWLQPLPFRQCLAFAEQLVEGVAQARHAGRQLVAAPRRLAQPERNVRRLALGVLDPHPSRLDADDPVRGVAQLEHVAGQALHREILVDRPHQQALRLQQHAVVAGIGNGPARGQRGQPRATAATEQAVERIAMEIGAAHAEA
ncbi:putative aTP-dependent DNA helicase [Pseudomonas aeruginosa]|nr:putative aTP-dependent DNA helicase [Pseudomonas aeruginosa]